MSFRADIGQGTVSVSMAGDAHVDAAAADHMAGLEFVCIGAHVGDIIPSYERKGELMFTLATDPDGLRRIAESIANALGYELVPV